MATRHPLATPSATHSATPSLGKTLERKLFCDVARSAQFAAATMIAKKTAWHPPFTSFLQERCPRWAKVTGEVQLTTEPLRVDDVIAVRADRDHDPSDTGTTLRGMWRFVVVVALPASELRAALPPSERLADLALDEAILAMPDAALRGLTEEFIATLRDDVQAAVRARRNAR